jgi:ribosome biogenesis GTPase / thiamine phosphate phosphatase
LIDLLGTPALDQLGWSTRLADAAALLPPVEQIDPDQPTVIGTIGRVIAVHRGRWTVASPSGLIGADLLGVFRLGDPLAVPAVGDWVRVRTRIDEDSKAEAALSAAKSRRQSLLGGTIDEVLPRSSVLVRKTAGARSDGQVIAANVDVVLVAIPLDADINPRRVERQLTTVWESGATPVIVGTKLDMATDDAVRQLREAAGDVDCICTSIHTREGLDQLHQRVQERISLVLLGTSGAGKSTLVNELLGDEVMATQELGAASKGQHTTTHREMLALPTGALLIDTPGMRELGLWMSGGAEGVAATFPEVDELAEQCRFSDCTHAPDATGCAIAAALLAGDVDPDRVTAWKHLSEEQQRNAARVARRDTRQQQSGRRRR